MAKERDELLAETAATRSSQRELLKAKLVVPPLSSRLFPRPGLIERLNEGFRCRLVLICAPAGYGKTTLLQQWLQQASQQGRPCAWVALDGRDDDPQHFWRYVLAALDSFSPGLEAQHLPLLNSGPSSQERLVQILLNALWAVEQECLLVLDDYHQIHAPAIHESMELLLRYLPPGLHLVIGTRVQPPFSLARFRAHGQVVELGANDLRLNAAESRRLLRECLEFDTPEYLQAELEAATEGWVVGLQLAARALSGEQTKTANNLVEGYGPLREYFAEEVFSQQPVAVQQFLGRTGHVERLCASLGEALAEQEHGREMLEMMARENLFLFPLNEQRGWYRYHPLFAGFLRATLRQAQPELLPVLQRRASQWYRWHGMLDEAIAQACAAADFEEAVSLIEQEADARIKAGEIVMVRGAG